MKFEIVGNTLDSSGYAIHTRSLFNAMAKTEDVKLTTGLIPGWERMVNDKELEAIKKEWEYDRVRIIITHPIHWRVNCTNKRNWVYLVWEGDKVPYSFVEEAYNSDIEYIIVPSEHTRRAIWNTYFNGEIQYDDENIDKIDKKFWEKVKIIPHGVDHALFKPEPTEKDKFTFLVNKGWRNNEDRGGTQYALKAYMEEFTNKEDVRMIVKINPAYGIPDINKLLTELAPKDRTDLPEIMIDTTDYKYEELPNLYNKADVFVSTTRAEAFNIPVLEAMSCGLPVIYTEFGGQAEFAEGWGVKYKLDEVKHELQYEGIKWATPDIQDIRNNMRGCFNCPNLIEIAIERALEKSMDYSWDLTAKQLISLF